MDIGEIDEVECLKEAGYTQEEIEEIDKQIEAEAAVAPDEPEDDMQSFVPKKGKFVKEDVKLKNEMSDIMKSVLNES